MLRMERLLSLRVRANHGGISRRSAHSSLAGNYGQAGPWLPSSPASGTDVIAVGSVDKLVAGPPSWNMSDH